MALTAILLKERDLPEGIVHKVMHTGIDRDKVIEDIDYISGLRKVIAGKGKRLVCLLYRTANGTYEAYLVSLTKEETNNYLKIGKEIKI